MSNLERADLKEFSDTISITQKIVYSYKKTRLFIKIWGIIGMIAALFLHYWLAAVLLWILFFPDLNEIVRFFRRTKQNI